MSFHTLEKFSVMTSANHLWNWRQELDTFLLPQHPIYDNAEDMFKLVARLDREFLFPPRYSALLHRTSCLLQKIIDEYRTIETDLSVYHAMAKEFTTLMRSLEMIKKEAEWNDHCLKLDLEKISDVEIRLLDIEDEFNNTPYVLEAQKKRLQDMWDVLLPKLRDLYDLSPEPRQL